MKLIALMILGMGLSAHADHHGKMMEDPSCSSIKSACEAGGYKMGDHKKNGKGLIVDCFHKLTKGEKVEGVGLDPADASIATCKEKMMAFKKEHKGAMKGPHGKAHHKMGGKMGKKHDQKVETPPAGTPPAPEAEGSAPAQ